MLNKEKPEQPCSLEYPNDIQNTHPGLMAYRKPGPYPDCFCSRCGKPLPVGAACCPYCLPPSALTTAKRILRIGLSRAPRHSKAVAHICSDNLVGITASVGEWLKEDGDFSIEIWDKDGLWEQIRPILGKCLRVWCRFKDRVPAGLNLAGIPYSLHKAGSPGNGAPSFGVYIASREEKLQQGETALSRCHIGDILCDPTTKLQYVVFTLFPDPKMISCAGEIQPVVAGLDRVTPHVSTQGPACSGGAPSVKHPGLVESDKPEQYRDDKVPDSWQELKPVELSEWVSYTQQECIVGKCVYRIPCLIEAAKARELPVMDVPLRHLNLCNIYRKLNLRGMVMHFKATMDSDLGTPIILDEDGELMDGRHRIMKALINGCTTIKAVRFDTNPPYDRLTGENE